MLQKTPSLLKKHKASSKSSVGATKLKTFSKNIDSHRLFKIAYKEGQVFDSVAEAAGYLDFFSKILESVL